MGKKMHQTRRIPLSTLSALLFLGMLTCTMGGCLKSNISDKKISYIDLPRAVELFEQQRLEDDTALFIDARKPERFAEGHIPGARNMRTPDVDLRYGTDPALERYKNLIVYGENPGTATVNAMAKRLIEVGYNGFVKKRVKVFPGGWEEWEITGLPIESDAPASSEGDE
jgi:rhodanese-related sulfurtransferase